MDELLVDVTTQVARVVVDMPLAHLDRLFDYTVPDDLCEEAVPGARVRVRFAGQLRDGWIVGFGESDGTVRLQPLHAIVSSEPIMTPRYHEFLRRVADHYAGVLPDVLRLAVPPRHAGTEKSAARTWPAPSKHEARDVLPRFDGGQGFLDALTEGRSPRAVWLVPSVQDPAWDLTTGLLEATDATLASGRGVIVIVPTARDLAAVLSAFQGAFGKTSVAQLSAELGRSARYRNFLAVSRGAARIVVGTRSAVFAPMEDIGLVAVVDDGNDSHSELRAPYPHSREVAVLRSVTDGCGVLFASHGRSAETQAFLERGWAGELRLPPSETRRVTAPVRVVGDDPSREPTAARLRLPTEAFRFLRAGLAQGPVLVQVPRAGHSAALTCERCRNRALCRKCSGALRTRRRDVPECSLCGLEPARWSCPHCAGTTLRAPIVGATRTAEELARAFPGSVAINSSASRIRSDVPDEAAIVVATPGAEPTAPHGYAGVLLLDTEIMLGRSDLRVVEESLRRWSNAIALARPPAQGGSVLAVGEPSHPALQALVRGDLPGLMTRELAERATSGLPPAARVVRVGGDPSAVTDFLDNDEFQGIDIIGPTLVPRGDEEEAVALLRAPLAAGRDLMTRVKHASAVRSARKEGGRLYVHTDPQVME